MNFLPVIGSVVVLLVRLAIWGIGLYLILRFLRALERGVLAHEQLVDAMMRQETPREPNITRTIP